MRKINVVKIISGGQSGVDRAALDFAIKFGIPHGGWCPKGRKAEDGEISEHYQLMETKTSDYQERTFKNVMDSDGTLIIVDKQSIIEGSGTFNTVKYLKDAGKPYFIVDLHKPTSENDVIVWLMYNRIRILNVAGKKESSCKGIYLASINFLNSVFESSNKQRISGYEKQ